MRTCPFPAWWFLLPVLPLVAACHGRGSSSGDVLGSATVGADGGVLEVTSGPQAGLRITVPPGATASEVRLTVYDVPPQPVGMLQVLPPIARAFRVEPAAAYFELPLTMRMPYDPFALPDTAPGNVGVRQTRSGGTVEHMPDAVDVADAYVEYATRTLGMFEVARGTKAENLLAYREPETATVALADGYAFVSEPWPDDAQPFGGPGAVRWRLTGPGIDEWIYWSSASLTGRQADTVWREAWQTPVVPWDEQSEGLPVSVTIQTQVSTPVGLPPVGGTLVVSSLWYWDLPQTVGDQLLLDVVRLQMTLAWDRHDIGTGQREYVFWFARDFGLVALGIDGIVHARTAP